MKHYDWCASLSTSPCIRESCDCGAKDETMVDLGGGMVVALSESMDDDGEEPEFEGEVRRWGQSR